MTHIEKKEEKVARLPEEILVRDVEPPLRLAFVELGEHLDALHEAVMTLVHRLSPVMGETLHGPTETKPGREDEVAYTNSEITLLVETLAGRCRVIRSAVDDALERLEI
jgi:hypothetical protein